MASLKHLLLLPGSLSDEYLWRHQIEALAGDYEILCERLAPADSLAEIASAVLGLAPPRFALVGYALGARVALEIMRTAPERVERLALVDASIAPVAAGEAERRMAMVKLASEQGMRPMAKHLLPMIHPSRHDDREFIAGMTEMICRFTPADFSREAHMLLNRPDQWPVLVTIRCPTLILAGAEDPMSTAERNRQFAASIPGSELEFVAGCAHFPMLEAPDLVTAALRRWLSTDPSPAAWRYR